MSALSAPLVNDAPVGYVAYRPEELDDGRPRRAQHLLRVAGALCVLAALGAAAPVRGDWATAGSIVLTPVGGMWFLTPLFAGGAFFIEAQRWPGCRGHFATGLLMIGALPALGLRIMKLSEDGWNPIVDYRDTVPALWLMTVCLVLALGVAVVALRVARCGENVGLVDRRCRLLKVVVLAAAIIEQWGTGWIGAWEDSWARWIFGATLALPLAPAIVMAARPTRNRLWIVAGLTCAVTIQRLNRIGASAYHGQYDFKLVDLLLLASPAACCLALRILMQSPADEDRVIRSPVEAVPAAWPPPTT